MSFGEKFIPLEGVNTDLSPALLPSTKATFIKNLVFSISDASDSGKSKGADTGLFKTYQSNNPYVDGFILPEGTNYCIGALSSKETRQVFVWVWNSERNDTIYVINGNEQTISIIKQGDLGFQLNPEHFIHQGAANIWVLYITNPDTGEKKLKTFLTWTDNFNPQRFTCVEDAIATGGFSDTIHQYFAGDYDKDAFINAGVAPYQECIQVEEVVITDESQKKNNNLLFNTWQFRIKNIDIWGRPSEYSIISDLYIPGLNDCLSSSQNISRCLDLTINTPPPNVDKLEIAYRNCNDIQWYTADILDLYNGSNLGDWWQRTRNQDIQYNYDGSKIIYRFCADRQCAPISPALTARLFNPIPNRSVSATTIGKTEAYSNNEYGFNPIPKDTLDKITVTVTPTTSPEQSIESRNITIYVPIYNRYKDNFQQVFKDGTLGYSWGDNNRRHGGARAYSQYFSNAEQQGFNGYLVGGPSAISTQVYVSNGDVLVDDVNHEGASISQLKYNDTGYTMQKFVFSNLPPGIYVFRLASHLSNPDTDVNYRKTSTTVRGVCSLNSGKFIPNVHQVNHKFELLIDVCNSDYNTLTSGEMLVIQDLAAYHNSTIAIDVKSMGACGYIYESSSEEVPVGLVGVNSGWEQSVYTDHNGFYWGSYYQGVNLNGIPIDFTFINKCVPVTVSKSFRTGNLIFKNFHIDTIGGSQYSDYSTTPCNRIKIRGKLTVQGTNIGIPGADIVLTRGAYTTTDSNGEFTLIAHDDALINPRKDKLIITNSSCRYYTEGQICITPIDVQIIRCNACIGERVLNVGNTFLLSDLLQRGLLSGGTYAVGIAGKDFLDRSQFVQDLGYITIPTVQETQVFAPSVITFNIDPLTVFPENIKYLVPYISEETTISDYVTWIVDSFELVDNTGKINNTNPTQIKIYYNSLVEYNKQNNYNTTVNWEFINKGTSDSPLDTPFTDDNVTFLVNGDGKFFKKSITSRVKYAQTGEYFLINYTDQLKDLKPNAFIRMFRPKKCVADDVMFEICQPVKIIDGRATNNSFVLNAFDTYYVNREIPVPVKENVGEEETETVLETRIFAYPFEHNSPSDFWGKGCKNIGRVNAKNKFEAVIYKQDEIALSGSFSENGYINYLNFFEDGYSALNVPSRKFSFDKTNINGIVSVVPQIGIVLVIGQYNNFTVGFNDNLLRATDTGIQMPSGDDTFGQPNVNMLDNYGCLIFDKNSIYEYEGRVQWLDSVNACIVQNNFTQADDISKYSCEAYIRAKIKEVNLYNKNNAYKRYFVGAVSPVNADYIITDKIIGNTSYVNLLRYKDVTVQETICFDIHSKMFKGWISYTAEFYSTLKGELNNQQLFSFKNGVPYYHYTSITDNISWGSFFGIPTPRVIEIVVSLDNIKKKKSLFTQVYSHNLYYVDNIDTESNQNSWIPETYFKQGDYFWTAPFLCDLNTPEDPNRKLQTSVNKLTDGDMLYGLWFKIRYVGIPSDDTKYTELTGFTVDVIPQEKSGT